MRNVGHKIAPHLIGFHSRRVIPCQHQFFVVAVRMQLHLKFQLLRKGIGSPINDNFFLIITLSDITCEKRVSHQVHNVLTNISFIVQTQMNCGCLVAPFNAALLIQQEHAIGRGLNGR